MAWNKYFTTRGLLIKCNNNVLRKTVLSDSKSDLNKGEDDDVKGIGE